MNASTRLAIVCQLGFSLTLYAPAQVSLAQDIPGGNTQRQGKLPANEKKSALSLPRLGLKNGKFMFVVDPDGMLPAGGLAGYGLYADDTRYLSDLAYTINGAFPTLLQASVDEGFAGRFLYGNRAVGELPEQSILLDRQVVIRDGLTEQITLRNYSVQPQKLKFGSRIYTTFDDMFEVRGQERSKRGTTQTPVLHRDGQRITGESLSYEGLDHNTMTLDIDVVGAPLNNINDQSLEFDVDLAPSESKSIEIHFQPMFNGKYLSEGRRSAGSFAAQLAEARKDYQNWRSNCASIITANDQLNRIIERSWRDLYMLRQPTPHGYCVGAGIPWYATAFGRDQLVVGMQTLPFAPQVSREVLSVLANYQGSKDDPSTEESPGKIMHELRVGEMARCKEIAFVPYYGTVDATPLWLMLLSSYVDWTDDKAFLEQMWPHVERALNYFDAEVAAGGGYLRYGLRKRVALGNQGWKDSGDAVSHKDGKLAVMPVALSEVQGYLYQSWKGTSRLARRLGKNALAVSLQEKASKLQSRFQRDFWMPEDRFVAMALDGSNKQCHVVSSNPGHLLLTGILSADQKLSVGQRLAESDMYCGWGIRTLSSREKRYNPMSYHNGSIWPHDNAMCVAGLCQINQTETAQKIVKSLLAVAASKSDQRLPELFCGFAREEFDKPVDYPVSCSPQAWAAGAVLQMLAALMNISLNEKAELEIRHPQVPADFGKVTVNSIRIGGEVSHLTFDHDTTGNTTVQIKSETAD